MSDPAGQPPSVWQPFTPRGVAGFGQARLSRLLLVQLVFALLAGACVAWFLHRNWTPVITAAIQRMPSEGLVRGGRLDWPEPSPIILAQNHFLGLAVDLDHQGEARSPAHLQVEFGARDIRLISLLGYVAWPYPRGWVVGFNRSDLTPWWGAWGPAWVALSIPAVALALFCVWGLLAAVYSGPVWLVALFANRELNWRGCWRLSGAALLPGALLFTGALVLYGLGALDLVQLAAANALHFLVGWVYLPLGVWRSPRLSQTELPTGNPFKPE